MIVDSDRAVTLLGGGEATPDALEDALQLAPILVAADGAAGLALAAGHLPDAVIGDLDSITAETRAAIPPARLHRIDEQDSTDFDKCLRSIRAPFVLGVGFMGRRLDHELAALSALVARRTQVCLLLGPVDLCFHAPPSLALDLPPGTRVSLYPLAPVTATAQGLRWPVDRLRLAPDGRIGTSNEATGPVTLGTDGPGLLVILPLGCLGAAIAGLTRAAPPDARGG